MSKYYLSTDWINKAKISICFLLQLGKGHTHVELALISAKIAPNGDIKGRQYFSQYFEYRIPTRIDIHVLSKLHIY